MGTLLRPDQCNYWFIPLKFIDSNFVESIGQVERIDILALLSLTVHEHGTFLLFLKFSFDLIHHSCVFYSLFHLDVRLFLLHVVFLISTCSLPAHWKVMNSYVLSIYPKSLL